MSGDRPKLISTPTSFSQGVARTDLRTWGVMAILFAVALAVVFLLNAVHEKQPMFGDAPFGSAPRQQTEPQSPPGERRREIPVVPAPPAPG
jgi:hypothetical protein